MGPVWRAPLSVLLLTDALPMPVGIHLVETLALARGILHEHVLKAVAEDLRAGAGVLRGIGNVG